MTTYRDAKGRRIEIRKDISGFVARRQRKDGTWGLFNFESTYCPTEAGAQARLDAIAEKKGLTRETEGERG